MATGTTAMAAEAESPPSPTSPNPPIEELGMVLSITGAGEGGALPAAAVEEEAEFLNAIENDLYKLTIEQAEIEWERRRSEPADGSEDGEKKSLESFEKDNLDAKDDDASVEDGGKSGDALAEVNLGRYNQSNNRRRNIHPMRPDAEDCAFYVKFGSCKFGQQCKFNHPPRRKDHQGLKEKTTYKAENSERAGQIDCKYFLTSGGCKYGKNCKYSHGSQKSSTSHTPESNFLGLPIRPGEKECPYYMQNGSCKYGLNCRFHHPEPTSVVGADSSGCGNGGPAPSQFVPSPSASSWSGPRAFNKTSPSVPNLYSSAQAVPLSNSEWQGYQASSSDKTLPIPPAFAMNNSNLSVEIHFPPPVPQECYPERPGEQECSFFMKTGGCKFKSNCKFHHPKNRISKPNPHPKPNSNQSSLNDKGLPLRPDQPICTHYHRYGICKFGPACKYDHPSQFAILQQQQHTPFGHSKLT